MPNVCCWLLLAPAAAAAAAVAAATSAATAVATAAAAVAACYLPSAAWSVFEDPPKSRDSKKAILSRTKSKTSFFS